MQSTPFYVIYLPTYASTRKVCVLDGYARRCGNGAKSTYYALRSDVMNGGGVHPYIGHTRQKIKEGKKH